MIRLRRRRGIAGTLLIFVIVLGLAIAAVAQTGARDSAALAATTQPAVNGTDVSNLTTGTYNWPDVKAAGMSFVGVLAYDGASDANSSYNAQVTGALGQGLYVMPYVVADPLKVATGTLQFTQHAWSAINGVPGHAYQKGGQYLPVVLDMESQPLVTSETCYGLTQAQMVTWIGQFITAANKQTGLRTVVYSNPSWWQQCTGNTTAAGIVGEPLWIADYGVTSPAIPAGFPGYTFWQSSGSGTVNGIPDAGAADLDNMLGAPSTDTVSTTGSLQLETLNTLAGQAVSYASAGSLPAHFTLSSAGVLSWSSAAVGTYSLGATATKTGATVLPSSLAVNLRVHGAITIANAARSSTAGTPVSFRIATSGPDQNAGVAPALKAAGLPSGVSMTSAGVVTGWPTRYGAFKVTVSASDALGGTGSASFTWTVKAAADAGSGGQIKQAGGSGKCLEDPAGKTANGTIMNLSTCTGNAYMRWTLVQDGTLRNGGKCLQVVGNGTANGVKVELEPCNSDDGSQVWQASTDGQLLNQQSGKCLDVTVASAANGTQPVIGTCENSTSTTPPSTHWLRPVAPLTSGQPGKCVGTSGTEAVLATCSTSGWQHWQPQANGKVTVNGWCLTEGGTTAGSKLSLVAAASCSTASAANVWKLAPDGLIATELVNTASGLCAADPASGTQLVTEPCATSATATWRFE